MRVVKALTAMKLWVREAVRVPNGPLNDKELPGGVDSKLLAEGVTDMVRISDARMSGTAYGTVVLHVAPEARAGGPLAVVRAGDWIELDCAGGRLHLDISDADLQSRLAAWADALVAHPDDAAGYRKLYVEHVLQADEGCDFDFLIGCRGAAVPAHSH
jgi:dihydroxy-acid dehydratase/L-arabonate dehydrase